MKKLSRFAGFLSTGVAILAAPFFAGAANQTWTPGGAAGGSGAWGTSGNWTPGPAWTAGNVALFGGPGGAVAVGPQSAGGLTFNVAGYTLAAPGTLTLTGSPVISLGSGVSATMGSGLTLAGAAGIGLNVTGGGTLALTTSAGGSLGSAASPAVWTVNGGSTLSYLSGNNLGVAPATGKVQVILDNGTMSSVGATQSPLFYQNRWIQVNAAGGAWLDAGGNNTIQGVIIDNATTGTFTINAPVTNAGFVSQVTASISGPGSLTKAGAGTASLAAANTYTGATSVTAGTLQLSGSLTTSGIAVGPGAGFAPSVTAGIGASSGPVGATLDLDGGTLDLSSANAATINTFTLNPGSNTFTGQAFRLQSGFLRFDLGSNGGADLLSVQHGTAAVGGTNSVRIVTGSSLAMGAATLISAPAGRLAGTYQFDGGNTVRVPALSQIKNVGGVWRRLTLPSTATALQVEVGPAPASVITIMPLGSSSTRGFGGDPALTGCGYRSEIYQRLVNDGRFTPNFIGSQTVPVPGTAPAGYDVATGANQVFNEGHSGYTSSDLMCNLNYNAGTADNNGGFWLALGNGKNPDYILLNIAVNDYVYNNGETINPVKRVDAAISTLQSLRPDATVVATSLFYRPDSGPNINAVFNPRIVEVVYNHTLAGHHMAYSDVYAAVTPNNSPALMGPPDQTHPSVAGYPVMGDALYDAVVYGSAYWTGSQDGQWSTVAAGNATNFAQNYALTIDRQKILDAQTDVYFHRNAAALATTLGQDLTVRGLNFTAGATGPVTVGGDSTLTLGRGGITVQAGSGAHTVAADVALGVAQTWGNVSASAFTVSGVIGGAAGLTTVGSYSVETQNLPSSSATTTQTFAGTGAIVLSGANTYSGGTAVNSGTLVVANAAGSATGSGGVNVASGATLTNNGAIGGPAFVSGIASGGGAFGGALTVNGGGVFNGAATVGGLLTVHSGGLIALAGGALNANGGVVNYGTIRLQSSAALVVASGQTLVNNGLLDVITGSFRAPGGFINNGVVLDSSLIKTKSVGLTGGVLTLTVDGNTGHAYQLQRTDDLAAGVYTNVGGPRSGATGSTLTFTDSGAQGAQGFYRVQVDR